MIKKVLCAALAAVLPVVGFAGTCEAPTPLTSNTTVAVDTCAPGLPIGLNLGGTILIHPSAVYSFSFDPGATPPNGPPSGLMGISGGGLEGIITTSCTSAAVAGDAVFFEGSPYNLGSFPFAPNTTYLVVVTVDPGLPQTTPPRCGAGVMNVPTVPVELELFQVD